MSNKKLVVMQMVNLLITFMSALVTPISVAHFIDIKSMKIWIIVTSLSGLISLFNLNSGQIVSHYLLNDSKSHKILPFHLWFCNSVYTSLVSIFVLIICSLYFFVFEREYFTQGFFLSMAIVIANLINVLYEPYAGLSFVNENYSEFLKKQVLFRLADISFFLLGLIAFGSFSFLPYYIFIKLVLFMIIFRIEFYTMSRNHSWRKVSFRVIYNENSKRIKANFRVSTTNWFRYQYLNVFLSSSLSVVVFGNISILRTISSGFRQISESILTAYSQHLIHIKENTNKLLEIHKKIHFFISAWSIPSLIALGIFFFQGPNLLGTETRIPLHMIILLAILGFLEIQNTYFINISSILDRHFKLSQFRFQSVIYGTIMSTICGFLLQVEFFFIGQIATELIFLIFQQKEFRKELRL